MFLFSDSYSLATNINIFIHSQYFTKLGTHNREGEGRKRIKEQNVKRIENTAGNMMPLSSIPFIFPVGISLCLHVVFGVEHLISSKFFVIL
jgi:hypothetical protein